MVVSVRDTGVLVLLEAHYDQMGCLSLFMKAGTSKYLPVHEIRRQIPFDQVSAILAIHTIPNLLVTVRKNRGMCSSNVTTF